MDTFIPHNPLQTVQLIPIFNYLNLLSDFLFMENYLTEDNQTKQIPIVNALYEYLADNSNNQSMTKILIRNLLKGSDLYGENKDEHLDVIFVNEMFDYIISSLVFDKYGNIYGFLVDVYRKAENLRIDYILNVIKENLYFASFENEYGERSTLSPLAVNRIYNDIILPLFPQAEKNLSLSSLDYIYAQAGLMFLRLARINTNYYTDFEHSNITNFNHNNLFEEYLVAGRLIHILLSTDNKNVYLLKFFALSALSNYVFNRQYLYTYGNTANFVSDSSFWRAAYADLFQYIFDALEKIQDQINNDNTLNLNIAFSRFRSRSTVAKIFLDHYCAHVNVTKEILLSAYLERPDYFQCKIGEPLPNLNHWYTDQSKYIAELYKIHDLQLVQKAFGKSLIDYIERANVTIKLLNPYVRVEYDDLVNSKPISCDVLEIYFFENRTSNYYALVRENYNVILINYAVNPQRFEEIVGLTIKNFSLEITRTLKTLFQDNSKLWDNLMEYKARRLQLCLQFLDDHQENEELWKSVWWKEFGLSSVPFYFGFSCTFSTNYKTNFGELTDMNFLDKFEEDISTKIINTDTQSLLSSLGTTLRSVFTENVCIETVHEFVTLKQDYRLYFRNTLNKDKIFDNISALIEDSTFELEFMSQDDISLLEKIIGAFKRKTNLNIEFFQSKLDLMGILKSYIIRTVGTLSDYKRHFIYVNTINNRSITGYGYRFIFISDNLTKIAYLRTDYEFRTKRLVLQFLDIPEGEKEYVTLNPTTLEPEPNSFMYEVSNQLRSKLIKIASSVISVYHDDDICNNNAYFGMSKYLNFCLRKWHFMEKLANEEGAVKFVQTNTNLSRKQIKITLNKYTFPDKTTLMQFVTNWIENKELQPPVWGNNFIIDNSAMFNTLKYNLRLESHDVSEFDGEFRIKFIYSHSERLRIDRETTLKSIIMDYNDQRACYSVTFEDYYAIRNFATTGYRRITGDTKEAKLMKLALYKLAIRQSDDADEEFDLKLFLVESKPTDNINYIFAKDSITLQKFTFASTSLVDATRFTVYPGNKFINIIYEMEFYGPYLRSKIEQTYTFKEENIILLPGSEFFITNRTKMFVEGLGTALKLKLEFKHNIAGHYPVFKEIMKRISEIQF